MAKQSSARALIPKTRPAQPKKKKTSQPRRALVGGPSSLADVQKRKLEHIQQQLESATMTDFAQAVPVVEEADMVDTSASESGDLTAVTTASARASCKAFGRHLKSAVKMSDVVIEVLDARDPNAYRSKSLEEYVLEQGKRLVILLNKIDLVHDQKMVVEWESYLRRQYPVVLFRAMTTASRSKQSTMKFESGKASSAGAKQLKSGYAPLGAADLMSLLGNYTRIERTQDEDLPAAKDAASDEEPPNTATPATPVTHKNISVCIVGMPNVGKTSIINSLMRNSKCLKTGNEPGVTRQVQTVRLTANIKLVDTPGVVLESDVGVVDQILRGTVKEFDNIFCDEAVAKLLKERHKEVYKYFDIEEDMSEHSTEQFLALVCERRGLFLSGGRRDMVGAKKCVIKAWVDGLINYETQPPPKQPARSIEIVATPSKELDLNNL